MTKDVIEAIKERRSVRSFKNQEVNNSTLGRILEAATWAPSAGNVQPWQFYVITNQKIKDLIEEASYNQKAVKEAPVLIVVGADLKLAGESYGQRGINLYCLQDTACAIQNMMLAANAFGLDTLWVGAFDEEKIKDIIHLPENIRPVAVVLIGYGDKEPHPPFKRPVEEVIHYVN